MAITPPPDPEGGTLGLIALGASSFLHDKDLNNPAFKKSKEAFCATLKDEKLTIFGDRVKLLDLFDKDCGPIEVVDEISQFNDRNSLSDILIYYCGHGLINRDTYVLALKGTRDSALLETGLRPALIRDQRDHHFPRQRLFLFLDCCYAAEAAEQWVLNRRSVPNRGTTIACAATESARARAPADKQLTLFTGSFLQALQEGIPGPAAELSLRDRLRRTQELIGKSNPHPVLHSPDQPPSGDIADVPLFVNRGFDRTIIAWRQDPRITYLSVPGMFGSERKLTFNDHNIVVRLSLRKLELYVDGVLRGSRPTQSNPDPNEVLLESLFADGGQKHTIKVYGKSSTWQGKLKLLLDDQPYGDEF